MKMLLWFLVGFFVVMWYLHIKKVKQQSARRERSADSDPASGSSSGPASEPASGSSAASSDAQAESMLRCAQCGLYVPASEAVMAADGRLSYCSDEHRLHHSG